jgi:hypothetical protein
MIGHKGVRLIGEWMQQAISWAQAAADILDDDISDERVSTQYERIFSVDSKSFVKGQCRLLFYFQTN